MTWRIRLSLCELRIEVLNFGRAKLRKFSSSSLRLCNAPIIGLPQDGGEGRGGRGVVQPRGSDLRKAHVGWDFDIHNDPRGGKFDSTAILKSWEELGMSECSAILEIIWARVPLPRMAERTDRSIVLLFFKQKCFLMPISVLSLKLYNIRYFSFSFEKRHSFKSPFRSKFTSYLRVITRCRSAISFRYSLCLQIC